MFTVESPKLFFTGGINLDIDSPLTIECGMTALVGNNGSGKSLFAKIVERGWNYRTNRITSPDGRKPRIKYIEFNDVHSWIGNSVGYYQQRYEAAMNDDVPTVLEIMGEDFTSQLLRDMFERFNLRGVESKKVNFLSSGELRKILIINALRSLPELLILDNPYIGLDNPSRKILNEALKDLKESGISIMLVLSDENEIPACNDHIVYACNLRISSEKILDKKAPLQMSVSPFTEHPGTDKSEILVLEGCSVNYGNIRVLDNLSWKVMSGEKWSLSGPNGSGKSTLLSLIYADNPKCYSNNLSLFGRRRGTGESIWDIKKRIGYVSPEMQLHFHGDGTIRQIVASGLNDTVGLFVRPTEQQMEKADKWLRYFGASDLSEKRYRILSSGERQLVLIVRAMIKEPDLLILDEPMHALDPVNRKMVGKAIDDFLGSRPSSAFIMVTHNQEELPGTITNHLNLGLYAT